MDFADWADGRIEYDRGCEDDFGGEVAGAVEDGGGTRGDGY